MQDPGLMRTWIHAADCPANAPKAEAHLSRLCWVRAERAKAEAPSKPERISIRKVAENLLAHIDKPAPPAPKPEPHLHGCKAAGLLKGEPGYDRCSCPPAPVSEPPDELFNRISEAIRRVCNGNGTMRIPADLTDPDLVLADCRRALFALKAQNADLQKDLVMMTQARDIIHADREECRAELDNLKAQNAAQAQELERLRDLIVNIADRSIRAARKGKK